MGWQYVNYVCKVNFYLMRQEGERYMVKYKFSFDDFNP